MPIKVFKLDKLSIFCNEIFFLGGDSLCNYIFLHCSHRYAATSLLAEVTDNIRINWHVCVLPDFSLENGAWRECGLCHCISFHFKVDPFSDDDFCLESEDADKLKTP